MIPFDRDGCFAEIRFGALYMIMFDRDGCFAEIRFYKEYT